MNPELFDIETLKMVGLWPNPEQPAYNLLPYVKRLRGDNLVGLDFGMAKGEDIRVFLDECDKIAKIVTIFDSRADYVEAANKNLDGQSKLEIVTEVSKEPNQFDFIFFNTENNVENNLKLCYDVLKPGGIFAGAMHSKLRNSLVDFRNNNKIRIPINKSHETWFWTKQ